MIKVFLTWLDTDEQKPTSQHKMHTKERKKERKTQHADGGRDRYWLLEEVRGDVGVRSQAVAGTKLPPPLKDAAVEHDGVQSGLL